MSDKIGLNNRQVQNLVHRASEIASDDDYLLPHFRQWVDQLDTRYPSGLSALTPLDFFESLLIDFDYFVEDMEAQ